MEKIYTKPIPNEIIAKGQATDGFTDIFSYEPDSSDDYGKLGSLFVVGHVNHETEDMAYLINLIAALAKREYYARPNLPAKEAFSTTLKKVNDILEEFFRNKGLEMNIGIFSIAGGQLNISRIGKFKIFMARKERVVDIMNNVDLFSKEHLENREFSNIISGAITPEDRLLAFYPAQQIVSRERYIKSYFVKLAQEAFAEKISGIKAKNKDFACSLLYISMQDVRETATAPVMQPQELSQVQLATAEQPKKEPEAKLALGGQASIPPAAPLTASIRPELIDQPVQEIKVETPEMPRIIPSEFSLGKRDNLLVSFSRRFRLPRIRLSFPVKAAGGAIMAGLLIFGGLSLKSKFFAGPETREARRILESVDAALSEVKSMIAAQNSGEARDKLFATLGILEENSVLSAEENRTTSAKDEIAALLDSVDNATEISPRLFYQIPSELGQAKSLAAFEDILIGYSFDETSNHGYVSKISKDGTLQKFEIQGMSAEYLFENSGSPVLLSRSGNKIASIKDGSYAVYDFTVPDGFVHASMYQDNMYALAGQALAGSGILKITDAAKGSQKSQPWLTGDASLPGKSLQIFVDGDIHILSGEGLIATYFKGKKVGEIKTPFAPGGNTVLLSAPESQAFYLFQKDLNRIYALDRKTGNLISVYKFTSPLDILSVAVTSSDTLYFLTADNKIWTIR